jgi:hypothetical protein
VYETVGDRDEETAETAAETERHGFRFHRWSRFEGDLVIFIGASLVAYFDSFLYEP